MAATEYTADLFFGHNPNNETDGDRLYMKLQRAAVDLYNVQKAIYNRIITIADARDFVNELERQVPVVSHDQLYNYLPLPSDMLAIFSKAKPGKATGENRYSCGTHP